MHEIKVLRSSGTYQCLKPLTIFTIGGEALLLLNQAPGLLINKVRKEMLESNKQSSFEVRNIMVKAAKYFLHSKLEGQTPDEYVKSLHRLSGLPLTSIHNAMRGIYTFLVTANQRIDQGLPQGAINYEQISAEYKGGVWAPYGELLSVIAPGNHPLSNQGWLEALSYGYRIMLRPSHRDPLTSYRLILALRKAGLAKGMVAYVPCDHLQVDTIVSAGDLSLVYGGGSMVERYQSKGNVILRGPGYSKILLESETFCQSDLMQKHVVESILDDGGVKCTNVSGLLVQGPITPVLTVIKQRLSGIKAAPLHSEDAVLPVMSLNTASEYYNHIKKICAEKSITLISASGHCALVDFGDGTACIEPVILLSNKLPEELDGFNLELPFPCVWITGWSEEKKLSDLTSTLALGLYIDNPVKLTEALANSNIKKIVTAGHQVSSNFDIPHDGFLSNRLLKVKGVKISSKFPLNS